MRSNFFFFNILFKKKKFLIFYYNLILEIIFSCKKVFKFMYYLKQRKNNFRFLLSNTLTGVSLNIFFMSKVINPNYVRSRLSVLKKN